ncbi:FAD/NAD-P-binding domain-containing protein [Peniophora sp. CONT]|nr:FAD/NAD-P-binding domain-containing protein [Peniophora sp. CONT]
MQRNSQKDFTVALVGGGIVGLTCAIGLARAGIQVDIFEATPKYGEIGAAVAIGMNAIRVYEAMGIFGDILALTEDREALMDLFTFVNGGSHDVVLEYSDPVEKKQGIAVHRAAFLSALERLLPAGVRSHFNKRCVSVELSGNGRPGVRFADGTFYEADIVIGADGIKSAVRTQLLGTKAARLVDTGTRAYRAVVPMQRLLDAGIREEVFRLKPRIWMGHDKHLATYPIMGGTLLNVVAFTIDHNNEMVPAGSQALWSAWVASASREELLGQFEDFGPDARAILNTVEAPNKWNVHGLYPPLDSFVTTAYEKQNVDDEGFAEGKGDPNVALVGDAAHAMLPHLGSGAGTGIEDAFVLASLLGHPQTRRANLPGILRTYDALRVPRAAYIATMSERAEKIYNGLGPSGADDVGRRKDISSQWEGIWNHDLQAEIAHAIQTLQEEGVLGSG